MARDRLKSKGRRESGRFAQIPDNVLRSAECHGVNGEAIRLLTALAAQYNGHNNGNLAAAMSIMRPYGFTRADTVFRSVHALLNAGLIIRTREGIFSSVKPKPALYALAWKRIDECPGKGLTVNATNAPPRTFRPADLAESRTRKSEQC